MSGIRAPRWVARLAFLGDVLVLVVFVVVGRRSHDEGSGLESFFRVWWPFALGLVVGTVATRLWKHPFEWRRVIGTSLVTVAVGVLLRIAVQERDFKVSFVIVATIFIGGAMLGWRALVKYLARRKLNPIR
jgi:Protein of unknown function (DUF3054)